MSLDSLDRAMKGSIDLSVGDIIAKYGDKQAIAMAVQKGEIADVTKAVMAGMAIDRIAANAMQPPTTTVAQDTFAQPQPQMGLAAAQQPQPQGQGLDQIPVSDQMFEPQGMAGGGIVAFQGGGTGKLDPRVAALMQRNPGMTLGQAARILATRAGPMATFGAGLAATDALMATDTGAGKVTPGYDYDTEQMAGGMPEVQAGTTGARGQTPSFTDYLRAVGLAPKEQVMDPATGKYVDVPAKPLFQSATPGLAGVYDAEGRPGVEEAAQPATVDPMNYGYGYGPESDKQPGVKGKAEGADTTRGKPTGRAGVGGEESVVKKYDPIAQLEAYEKRLGIVADPDAETRKELEEASKKLGDQKEQNVNMALLKAGLAMMGGESPYAFVNIAKGGMAGLEDYGKSEAERRKEEKDLMKARADLRRADAARKEGRLKDAIQLEQNYITNSLNIRKAAATELQAQAAMISAQRGPADLQTYETWAKQQEKAGKDSSMEAYRNSSPSVQAARINLMRTSVEEISKNFEPGGVYSAQYKKILKDKGQEEADKFKRSKILADLASFTDFLNRGTGLGMGGSGMGSSSGMPQLNLPPDISSLLTKQYPAR